MPIHKESNFSVIAAIVANLVIATIKFIAAAITGSSAMIAEGIHSLVDTGNGGLILFGLYRSARPENPRHPFGYGKELYFWSLIVAISIFGIGGGMSVYEGILHIREPSELHDPSVNYWVLGIATLVEGTSFVIALRQFWAAKGTRSAIEFVRKTKDPSLFTVVFEDAAAMLGLLVAFIGVFLSQYFNEPRLDGAASVLIGVILMAVAWVLAIESKGLLIGEGVDAAVLERMHATVDADPDVEHVGKIRTLYFGPHDLLVTLDVVFQKSLLAEAINTAIGRIHAALRQVSPEIKHVYIEVESLRDLHATQIRDAKIAAGEKPEQTH